jgi:transposase
VRIAPEITLSSSLRAEFKRLIRSRSTTVRLVQRLKIVLLADEGFRNDAIAETLGINLETVGRWRRRFSEKGFVGIERDATRLGRFPKIPEEIVESIVQTTLQTKPKGMTHWSSSLMSSHANVSESSVLRIWRRHGLKPYLSKTFKLSNDPRFTEKLEDIVGLYMNPPEHALVLSVDEKSSIQALDRTQPSLPLSKDHAATMTHDYKRNGTTTLFAALSMLDGTVIQTCRPRHTHKDWLAFLRLIDKQTPPEKQLHVIADNYATHKHAAVKRWLARHPRFHMHFTPTSSSWLNMVERFFRDITVQCLRRGAFGSVSQVIEAINAYIAGHNENPKPFIWTAKAKDILEKVKRARTRLKTASA